MNKLLLLTLLLLAHQASAQDTSCKNGQALFQGFCVSECPPNYIVVKNRGVQECLLCRYDLFEVPTNDKNQCQCALKYYRANFSGQCQRCHESCLTCRGPSAGDCITCSTQEFQTNRIKSQGRCACQDGYFENADNINCQKCHSDCLTCSGPTETDCINCAPGRVKNDRGECICSDNFITNDNGVCYCPSQYTLTANNKCVVGGTSCGPNQVEQISTVSISNNKGKSAAANKKDTASSVICVCRPGLFQIKGECKTCGQNEIFNEKNHKCECQPGAFKFEDGCVACLSSQSFDKKLGVCVCKKNEFKKSNGECVRCPNGQQLINDVCDCVSNYFRDEKSGKCKRCTPKQESPRCSIKPHTEKEEKLISI